MAEPLSWELEFLNSMSGPLREIAADQKAFLALVTNMTKGLEGFEKMEKEEGRVAHEAKEEHENFFGNMLEAEVIGEQVRELVDHIEELSEELFKTAIEAGDFDYKTSIALKHMTGSAEEAEDIMRSAKAFALGTGEDLDAVVSKFQQLASTGLKADQLTGAAAAAKDLAIVSGQSFDQTSELFKMIGGEGGLGPRAVMQLRQFPGLLKQIKSDLNITGEGQKGMEDLAKHFKDAPMKGVEGVKFFEAEILKVAHEGALGEVAYQFGTTFEGTIGKVKDAFKIMLGDVGTSPEMDELRTNLAKVVGGFDFKALEPEIKSAMRPLQDIITYLKNNPDMMKTWFEAGLAAAKGVGYVAEGILHVFRGITDAMNVFGAVFGTLAGDNSKGLSHIMAALHAGAEQDKANRGVPTEEDIKSASAVPVGLPAHAEGGVFDTPHIAMVAEKGPEAIIPGSQLGALIGGGRGATSNSVSIQVHVEGGGHMDEQALAAKLQEILPAQLVSALDQMAEQAGG